MDTSSIFDDQFNSDGACFSQDDIVDLTPASPQLSSWLVRASCTEVLQRPASSLFLVFLDFAKYLRKWYRVFSAPCMDMVESSE